jgi:hypothetical protein
MSAAASGMHHNRCVPSFAQYHGHRGADILAMALTTLSRHIPAKDQAPASVSGDQGVRNAARHALRDVIANSAGAYAGASVRERGHQGGSLAVKEITKA